MSPILSQTWTWPVLIGVGAFILGLVVASVKKSGSSWFSAVVFFLPNLLLDFLDVVHTKKFKYYGLILALISIEAFFAFRAATVYYDVLHERMPGPEMAVVCVIVFVAIFLCGYMVATHGKWTFWSVCTMIFVIIHDWAGTIWMNYSQPATATTSATIATPDDPLKVILTIGMCVLGLLPFIMGAWAEELRPELEKEQEEEVNAFTSTAARKIKRRAVDRVLRLANHTNVVHLVRALPADEFADFKRFVMPIIAAPGTPHNIEPAAAETQPEVATPPLDAPLSSVPLAPVPKVTSNGHTPKGNGYQRYLELVTVNPNATAKWLAHKLQVSQSSIQIYRRQARKSTNPLGKDNSNNEHDESQGPGGLTIFHPTAETADA